MSSPTIIDPLHDFVCRAVVSPQTVLDQWPTGSYQTAVTQPLVADAISTFYYAAHTFVCKLKHISDNDSQTPTSAVFDHTVAVDQTAVAAVKNSYKPVDRILVASGTREDKTLPRLTRNVPGDQNQDQGGLLQLVEASEAHTIPPQDTRLNDVAQPCPPSSTTNCNGSLSPSTVDIPFDEQDGVLRLRPSTLHYQNFPLVLRRAQCLGAEKTGVFKILLPDDMMQDVPSVDIHDCPVSVFTSSRKADGVFRLDRKPTRALVRMTTTETELSIDAAQQRFEALLADKTGFKGVYYCTDHDARTEKQRRYLGLPAKSPIWPLTGNALDQTKRSIPGLHYPFGYKSGDIFGAPFAMHREDYDLVALNMLYMGRKIWTVSAPEDAILIEDQHQLVWQHSFSCAQRLRHCSTIVASRKLREWARCVTFDQRPGEVVVVLPRAYHTGFSVGSSLGEAVNYAPADWTIEGYASCALRCPGHPIPNEAMAFRQQDKVQQETYDSDSDSDSSSSATDNSEDQIQISSSLWSSSEADIQAGNNSRLVVVSKQSLVERETVGHRPKHKRQKREPLNHKNKATHDVKPHIPEDKTSPRKVPADMSLVAQAKTFVQPHVEVSPSDRVTVMASAVGCPSAFLALKQILTSTSRPALIPKQDLFANDPKILISLVDGAETSETLHAYLRRFALTRLAQTYHYACQHGGSFESATRTVSMVQKTHKIKTIEAMIERIWGTVFPVAHRRTAKTRRGLIDADDTAAGQWNRCKARLTRRLEAGQRWLGLVDRHGWSVLGLIPRDWNSAISASSLTDSTFEQRLSKGEYEQLLLMISSTRRRFLRDVDQHLGSSLLDVLMDPSRAHDWELIQREEAPFMTDSDDELIKLLQST